MQYVVKQDKENQTMTQNLFDTIYIANKSYQELIDLFNVRIQDDCDYYPIIAYHLLQNKEDSVLNNFQKFNEIQQISIITAFGFFDKASNKTEKFF